jgi:mono/diheme cytochrome c family protein
VPHTHSSFNPGGARIVFLFLPVLAAALLVASLGWSQEKTTIKKTPITHSDSTSGKQMFADYCAPCHGLSGKGEGPAATALKTPPADLTQLAKKNNGKFPIEHVMNDLRQGSSMAAHGSSEMPVWGPLFKTLNATNPVLVDQRIRNLAVYIESLQAK